MKKTAIIFVICALLLVSLAVWALTERMAGSTGRILEISVVLIIVGFAAFLGLSRMRSLRRKEAFEDEFSRQVMNRAAALSYYASLFLWLAVMYFSDRRALEPHSLIGTGITGMALIFVLSWLWVRMRGMKNE